VVCKIQPVMMRIVCLTAVFLLLLLGLGPVWGDGGGTQLETGQIFSTWEGLEVDKCASIWLIKRFINPHAHIRFYKKEQFISEGILFDTPDAKFRRYHNKSTFESLVEHYLIMDSKIIFIARIIHDIEVNLWEKKVLHETPRVLFDINQIIREGGGNEVVLKKCNRYFNQLYHNLSE